MYEKVYLKLDGVVRFAFIDKTTLKNVRKWTGKTVIIKKCGKCGSILLINKRTTLTLIV